MSELLINGTPKDVSSIQDWNAFNVRVETNNSYGYVYDIQSTGYMSQFIPIGTVMNSVTVTVEYLNKGTGIQGTLAIYEADSKTVSSKFFLSSNDEFETLSFSVPTDGTKVTQVAFEIINSSMSDVKIAGMSLDGTLVTQAGSINTSDFIQSSIMFGIDSAKPDLG
jgi:hypothetical protein